MLHALFVAALFYFFLEKYTTINPVDFTLGAVMMVAPYFLFVGIKIIIDEWREDGASNIQKKIAP
ncbi:hypothetical protein [Dickeya poaceiphila]|uniref:Uncharacterized protein n=1 Tax=Dickeya poaceiphila TaxID=568768 RepID=A0A5B8I992_9GAMM|nr:hypothetical protein [Dickeya poaceiphila]QDX30934.1 hypothetical protein Dpoa569_0002883 [Dickeya poaceiphila]